MPHTADCFSQKITWWLCQIPYSHEGTVNEEWEKYKGAIIQAAKEALGKIIQAPRKMFDDECLKATGEKNSAYKLMHQKCHMQNAVKNYQEERKTASKLHHHH